MAARDDFVSVLEKGDMSSPAYRKQLGREQALENVYPETWGLHTLAKGAIERGVNFARGLRNVAFPAKDLAGTVTGSPHMDALAHELRGPAASTAGVDRSMAAARFRSAAGGLTEKQLGDLAMHNTLPADWVDRMRSASVIGVDVGKARGWSPQPPPPSATRDSFFKMYDPVEAAAVKRFGRFDVPVALANAVDNKRQPQPDPTYNGLRK